MNCFMEISARQTGKTTRLLEQVSKSDENAIIICHELDADNILRKIKTMNLSNRDVVLMNSREFNSDFASNTYEYYIDEYCHFCQVNKKKIYMALKDLNTNIYIKSTSDRIVPKALHELICYSKTHQSTQFYDYLYNKYGDIVDILYFDFSTDPNTKLEITYNLSKVILNDRFDLEYLGKYFD